MSATKSQVAIRPENIDLRELTLPTWKSKSDGGVDPQDMSVQLYPSVYVLELEDNCYYVGLATAGTGSRDRGSGLHGDPVAAPDQDLSFERPAARPSDIISSLCSHSRVSAEDRRTN
eukprot:COSAG01_NODE_21706_length_889_cov_1.074684_2_plen_117_part_00